MSQNYNNSHTWANLLSIPPPPFIKFAARPPFYLISHSDVIYLRIAHEDPNGWASFAFAVVIPTVQLILLLLYWGIELLAGAAKRR